LGVAVVVVSRTVFDLGGGAGPIDVGAVHRPVADEAVLEGGVGGDGLVDVGRLAKLVEALHFVRGEGAVVDADVVEEPLRRRIWSRQIW